MADTAINGIPILDSPLGFGVPEPPPQMVAKSWKRMAMSNDPQKGNWWIFYWRLIDGRTVMFNPLGSTRWKVWRDYKSIVIGKSLTSRNVTQVARRIHRHAADMRKVLKDIK